MGQLDHSARSGRTLDSECEGKGMADKPAIRRHKEGALSDEEKRVAKALLEEEWRNQDIVALFNVGREHSINSARITEVKQDDKQEIASKEDVEAFVTL